MKIFSILWSFKRAYHSKKILFLILTAIFVGAFVFGIAGFSSPAFACPEPEECEFSVEFNGRTLDNQDTTSTWSYTIHQTGDCPDISHWIWEPCFSLEELEELFVEAVPDADEVGFSTSTGHYGVKWESPSTTTFSVTIEGQPDIDEEGATAVIKAGQSGDQTHGYQPHFDLVIPGPSCAEPPEEPTHTTTTIYAYKVVCESEEDLPNWGNGTSGPSQITATTAIDYIANSSSTCCLADGWDFQWGYDGQAQKQAGDYIGPAPDGTGWNDFDLPTSTTTPSEVKIIDLEDGLSTIWVRENLQEGYISFSNPSGDLQNASSAEMWCHDDVLNYDNYDYIRNPQPDQTYYCVAFNAPIPEEPRPYCGDGNLDQGEECEVGHDCGCGYVCNLETCLCEEPGPGPEPQPFCGDGNLDQDEKCDDGQDNGVECTPEYGLTCNYCSLSCDIVELQGGYCGDGVVNGPEDCEIDGDCCPGMSCVECSCYTPITYFISGLKFNDKNNNGIKDCFIEPGLEGWTIIIEGPYQFNDSTTTDEEGRYKFSGLIPGTYTICEELETGWEQTYPTENDGCHIIEIIDGSISEVNFGNHQLPYCGDGNLDTGEECEVGHDCDCGYICNLETCLCEEPGPGPEPGPSCGDGNLDPGEECDDGNTEDGDGCSAECVIELPPQPECTPQATTTCSTGKLGICSSGTQTCSEEGFWGECEQDNQSVAEICNNGLDDDCDGNTDCDDGDCEEDSYCEEEPSPPSCTPEETRPCGTGLLGICAAGTQTCNSQGFWGVCEQNNQPTTEICNNGLDDDCDGATDCSDSDCIVTLSCYVAPPGPTCLDLDSDGYNAYAPYCLSGTDCDDSNPNINPGVSEICNNGLDDDCDGDIDCDDSDCAGDASCGTGGPVCTDSDGDGYAIEGDVCGPVDCDDANSNINPEANEVCDNGLDDDCDGLTDCDDGDCVLDTYCGGTGGPVCTDSDGDGFSIEGGDCGSVDCDDTNPNVNPLAIELCDNGLDDDCDGDVDCDDSDCTTSSFCVPPGPTPECESGEQQSCDTILLGICSVGTQTCNEAGFWGDCLADYEASFEICDNGLDDDCDGSTDCDDSDCTGVISCVEGGEEEEEVGFFGAALAQVGNFFSNLLASVSDAVSRLLGFFTNGKGLCLCLPACFPWWIILILFLYSAIRTIRVWDKDNKEKRTWLVWTLILLILAVLFLFEIFVCLTFWIFIILLICTYLIHRSLKKKEEEEATYKLFE